MTIDRLIDRVEAEARREPFPLDVPVYVSAGKDPYRPVLHGGSLRAAVAVMGRDLGRDEVAAGQPLIGAGGRLVREGIYRAAFKADPPPSDRTLSCVREHVLLTNTVPYKPPGNKAYAAKVKERFRPFAAELLTRFWTGDRLITLGNEAFAWFAPYAADASAFEAFWAREDRYEAEFVVTLTSPNGDALARPVRLLPLPHPSPLNARWHARFPALLAQRLADVPFS
ncbi:MAG: uracil-DNA glycosylase family protein [Isosphaeraceae bacterium]